MGRRATTLPRELASARRRIDGWRAGNDKRRLIPEPIWAQAVGLARVHGASRVSAAMRLSYEGLKSRLGNADRELPEGERTLTASASPPFIEIPPVGLRGEATVEIAGGAGRHMTIHGVRGAELPGVVAAFCGA